MTTDTTSPTGDALLCFGFAEADAPVLEEMAAGRAVIFAGHGGEVAASALLARGEACGDALAFAARHGDTVLAVVLVSPRPSALPHAGTGCKAQVLALAGTLDADGGRAATELKKSLPACHLVYVFDAGQDMAAQRPAAVVKVARDFLARRDKFLVSNADGRLTP